MRLRPEQLQKQLGQQLAPAYLIYGDEPLLVQECADAVRAACRKQGFSDRQVFHVDNHFDWQQLQGEVAALSLFAERKLLELRMPSGKPGDAGSKAIEYYCANTNPDTVLLILCEKLESSTTRSKWYKAVETQCATVQVWPVDATQLPRWIEQRLRAGGLSASPQAIELLCERVQGNLLAAVQEIEKLKLYTDASQIDVDLIEAAVGDSARYDAFGLADQVLGGHSASALRALAGLRGESVEPPVILWVLAKELRVLYRCAEHMRKGLGIDRAMDSANVWDRRKPLVRQALQRVNHTRLGALLQLAQRIDAAVKGASKENPWQLLDELALGMST